MKSLSLCFAVTICLCTLAVPAAHADLTDGLVAYWNLDADFNATIGGSGFNAIPVNNPTIESAGKFYGAADFDRGASDYLRVDQAVITQGQDHSYAAWYYLEVGNITGSNRYFVMESTAGAGPSSASNYSVSYGLREDSGDKGQVYTISNSGTSYNDTYSGAAGGAWHHICVTYDASSAIHYVYIDGVYRGSISSNSTLKNTGGLIIGGHRDGVGRNWQGRIDEVAFWDRIITIGEIAELQTGPIVEPPDLEVVYVNVLSPAGTNFDVNTRVRNNSTTDSPGFNIRLYYAEDASGTGAWLRRDEAVGPLAAGEERNHILRFSFSPCNTYGGTRYVIARLDEDDDIFESDESNNEGNDSFFNTATAVFQMNSLTETPTSNSQSPMQTGDTLCIVMNADNMGNGMMNYTTQVIAPGYLDVFGSPPVPCLTNFDREIKVVIPAAMPDGFNDVTVRVNVIEDFVRIYKSSTPGSISLGSMPYVVQEEDGQPPPVAPATVGGVISVHRTLGNVGTVSVDYHFTDGTAVAGADYEASVTGTLTWLDHENDVKYIDVPVINDTDPEATETFNVVLANPTGGVALGVTSGEISIIDEDGPGRVGFTQSLTSGSEGGGSIAIELSRTLGKAGDITLFCFATDGTATHPADFYGAGALVQWLDGEDGVRYYNVPVTDDSETEYDEDFHLGFTVVVGNPTFGATTSMGQIVDNELRMDPSILSSWVDEGGPGAGANHDVTIALRSQFCDLTTTEVYADHYYGDGTGTSNLTYLGRSGPWGPLNNPSPGWTQHTASMTMPDNVLSGDRYIHTFLDPDNVIIECNESDNYYAAPFEVFSLPDLESTLDTMDNATPMQGDTVKVSFTVTNTDLSRADNVVVRIYESTDATINASDTQIAPDIIIPSLNAGASYVDTVCVVIPDTIPHGSRYVGVFPDWDDAIDESDDGNNPDGMPYDLQPRPTGLDDFTPRTFALHPARPNPFNPSTTMSFDVPRGTNVRVAVYDVGGRLVRTLADRYYGLGRHEVRWSANDASGQQVGSGVYFVRMSYEGHNETQKVVLLK